MKNIFLILTAAIVLVSCTKEDNEKVINGSSTLTGANVVPSVTTTGTAKFDYAYNYNLRSFVYTITYSGLSDSCLQFGIAKANAGSPMPSSIHQLFNFSTPTSLQRRISSTYTGNFVVDGQAVTLDELRNGKYCVYLRTKTYGTSTQGELRAQIAF